MLLWILSISHKLQPITEILFISAPKKINIISYPKHSILLLKQQLSWNSAHALLFTRLLSSIYNSLAGRLSPWPRHRLVQAPGWVAGIPSDQLALNLSAQGFEVSRRLGQVGYFGTSNNDEQSEPETEMSKSTRAMHSHTSRGYPWPSHGLYLTFLSLVTLGPSVFQGTGHDGR